MVVRTYIDKTNTVVSNSNINTGKNPVSELFYGVNSNGDWVYSRLLVKIDLTNLKKQYADGMLGDLSDVTHELKLINTGSFHDGLLNKKTGEGKKRTSSFTLVAYEASKEWSGGTGYDYTKMENATISTMPSNWYDAMTDVSWGENPSEGMLLDPNTEIASQTFDEGNEDLILNITTWVNTQLLNDTESDGLIIMFENEAEPVEINNEMIDRGLQYVGFFTNNTQTFYQPFVETKYSSYIRDDRRNFEVDRVNRLYLYVNANGEPRNLSDTYLPTVTINLPGSTPSSMVLAAKHEKKGVYYVEVDLSGVTNLPQYFTDTWDNLYMDVNNTPKNMNPVIMGVEVDKNKTFFDLGLNVNRPADYKVVISGLRQNESILRGDVRRVMTNAMIPYTVDQKVLLDNIEYRLYVKEGTIEHTVIDYEPVERSYKDNYFLLDTQSLLPNIYYLDVRMTLNLEVKSSKEVISFRVVE